MTDTTIIDRLRKRAREEPSNGQGGGKLLLDAADALTAAHAARDAATKTVEFLKAELAQLADFNPDWDRLEAANDALREHAAAIHDLRAQLATALRERDEARAAHKASDA